MIIRVQGFMICSIDCEICTPYHFSMKPMLKNILIGVAAINITVLIFSCFVFALYLSAFTFEDLRFDSFARIDPIDHGHIRYVHALLTDFKTDKHFKIPYPCEIHEDIPLQKRESYILEYQNQLNQKQIQQIRKHGSVCVIPSPERFQIFRLWPE